MSKSTSKSHTTPTGGQDSPERLDEKIADVTVKTVRGIRKYRITFGALICAVILIALAYSAYDALATSRKRELAGEAYELFESPAAREAEAVAAIPRIEAFLDSARGATGERNFYKQAVRYLLDRALERAFPESEAANSEPADTAATPVERGGGEIPPRVLEATLSWVEQAEERFPGDEDMQQWAASTRQAVNSLGELGSKTEEKRPFRPVIPPSVKTETGTGTETGTETETETETGTETGTETETGATSNARTE